MKQNPTMRRCLQCLALGLVWLTGSSRAEASPYQSTTGLTSPGHLLNFSEVLIPKDTQLTNQFNSYGVNFTGAIYDPYAKGSPSMTGLPHISGDAFSNFIPNVPASSLTTITFSTDVQSAVFSLISQPGTTQITSYLNNVQVESAIFSTNLSSTNNFLGFTNSDFNSLTITVASSDRAFIADNLQFSAKGINPAAVPELSTSLGFGSLLALGGLAAFRQRKTARKAA